MVGVPTCTVTAPLTCAPVDRAGVTLDGGLP
ncbi:hypothetical protein SAMN05444695_110127 [Rhodococcus triatomae]|uniref:Uncharacterized protein n=1 Tax=Rhodococcus triatomae TaxID=300028 RepID=A0A1G8MZ61_9NOCA|nr:hypothetical protein SAMN05444695_110127 [Rhodococcus triatomae]